MDIPIRINLSTTKGDFSASQAKQRVAASPIPGSFENPPSIVLYFNNFYVLVCTLKTYFYFIYLAIKKPKIKT
jgi:hypothetical protein